MKHSYKKVAAFILVLALLSTYLPMPVYGEPTSMTNTYTSVIGWDTSGGYNFSPGNIALGVGSGDHNINIGVLLSSGSRVASSSGIISEASITLSTTAGGVKTAITSGAILDTDTYRMHPTLSALTESGEMDLSLVEIEGIESYFSMQMEYNPSGSAMNYVIDISVEYTDGSQDTDTIYFDINDAVETYITFDWTNDNSTIDHLNYLISDYKGVLSDSNNLVYFVLPERLTSGGATTVQLTKPVGLISGNDSGWTTIEGSIEANYTASNSDTHYNSRIENITLDGSSLDTTETSTAGVYVATPADVDDEYVDLGENFTLQNCIVTGFAFGVIANSQTFTMSYTTVGGCEFGLQIMKAGGGAYDLYKNCSFVQNEIGVDIAQGDYLLDNFYDINIVDNFFENNAQDFQVDPDLGVILYATKNIYLSGTPTGNEYVELSPYRITSGGALQFDLDRESMYLLGNDTDSNNLSIESLNTAITSAGGFTVNVNNIYGEEFQPKQLLEEGQWYFEKPSESGTSGKVKSLIEDIIGSLKNFFFIEAYADSNSDTFDLALEANTTINASLVSGFGAAQAISIPNNAYASLPAIVSIPLNDDLKDLATSSLKLYKLNNGALEPATLELSKESTYAVFTLDSDDDGGTYVIATPKPASSGKSSGPTSYGLLFQANGGSVVNGTTVLPGQTTAKPSDPTRMGYTFGGWYQDKDLTKPFDFSTKITADMQLYAKWVPLESLAPDYVFKDLGNHSWAADFINKLYQRGVVSGVSETQYAPSKNIIRGDFILMIQKAFNLQDPVGASATQFGDVPDGSYYGQAIITAKSLGIAAGSNGSFAPQGNLSREDAMVLIYRTLKYTGKTIENGTSSDLQLFSDKDTVSAYALEAVTALVKSGLVHGSGGKLNPKATISRAEIAVILNGAMDMN